MKNLLKILLVILSAVLVVKTVLCIIDYIFKTYSDSYIVTPLSDKDN